MERIDAPLSKDYPPLKLHLDDLEDIARVFADSGSAVKFETQEYRFNSIAELESEVKRTRLESVHIKSEYIQPDSPYVTLELTRRWARLYVSSRRDRSAGIFYNVDQVLTASRRPLSRLYSYGFVWVLNALILFSNVPQLKLDNRVEFAATLVMAGWVAWVSFIRMTRHSIIILKRKNAEGAFLERNRDNLAVALIAAVLGALIGIAGTVLLAHPWK